MDEQYDITWSDIDEAAMVKMVTGRSVVSADVSEAKRTAWENTRANKMHQDALDLHPIGWYLCSSRNGADDNLNNTVVRVLADLKDTIWICQHASPKGYGPWKINDDGVDQTERFVKFISNVCESNRIAMESVQNGEDEYENPESLQDLELVKNVRLLGCEVCPLFATNVKRRLLEHHRLDINIFILTPMSDAIYIPSNQEPGVFIYGVCNKIGGVQSYKNKYRNTRTQNYDFSTLYNDHYNYREDWETELWYFVNAENYKERNGFERLIYKDNISNVRNYMIEISEWINPNP